MNPPSLGRSLAIGFGFGLLAAMIAAWPIARGVAWAIDAGIGEAQAIALIRIVQQATLWVLGLAVALGLLRLGFVERYGASLAAVGPILFDAVTALAFGMLPVVLGTWVDRAMGALALTLSWLLLGWYSRQRFR